MLLNSFSMGSGGFPQIVTYVGGHESASDLQTYTFSSVDLKGSGGGNMVVVCVTGEDNVNAARTISSLTVAGVSAVKAVSENQFNNFPSNYSFAAEIWYANTSAATGNIVITWNGVMRTCMISKYRCGQYKAPTQTISNIPQNNPETTNMPTNGLISIGVANAKSTHNWSGTMTENRYAVTEQCGMSSGSGPTGTSAIETANFIPVIGASWS